MLSFLFVLLSFMFSMQALEPTDLLSQTEKMHVLENGVTTYVSECAQNAAAVHIVSREGGTEQILYTLDLSSQGLDELQSCLQTLKDHNPESLDIVAVGNFDEETTRLWLHEQLLAVFPSQAPTEASILPVVNTLSSGINHYAELPLRYAEMKIISRIIRTMAEKNVFRLLLEKKKMERDGEKIEHVHPMKFLGFIFEDPHLRHCMQAIKKSYFKWNGFMEGLSERMKEESERNNLAAYVPGFAKAVETNPDDVMRYIRKHDWDGLVRSLL
jgi:hypothetical protein